MRASILLAFSLLARLAHADPSASVEVGVRGAGTLAAADDPMSRSGAVPSLTVRTERSLGSLYVGANLAAGFPAWYGQHELSLSVGLARSLRESRCTRVDLDAEVECDARLALSAGVDAGVALLFFDAPPELSSSSDAILYWGPLARARVALRAAWPMANDNELGLSVGAGVAVVFAQYMTTAAGSGVRLEPAIDVAGVIGF